jgi:hypothetical protein
MNLTITEKDLNKSIQTRPKKELTISLTDCLLATALKRTLNTNKDVRVGFVYAYLGDDKTYVKYDIPEGVTEIIQHWCDGDYDYIRSLLPYKVELKERE